MKTLGIGVLLSALAAVGCGKTAQTPSGPNAPVTSALEAPRDSGGFGWLSARGARGEPGAVELTRVHVSAKQVGDYAALSIDHVFQSQSDAQLEGVFRFPLPEGALLTGLAMLIDGKLVEGELVEREKARKAYEQIVDSMQDPALLEWEHGSTFKMRVFPIVPHEQKRVTVRYLVPLTHSAKGWVFSQSTRRGSSSEPVPELRIDWEGKPVFQERDVHPGRVIETPAADPAIVLREQRDGSVYTAVRVHPDWSKVPVEPREKPRHVVFALDTSRSSLEESKLSLEALRAALSALTPDQSFVVVTHDLDARIDPHGFMPAEKSSIEAALTFANQAQPDGATDLGALFDTIARIAHGFTDVSVVYIGDCEPSWGILDQQALVERARGALGKTAFNPIVIGSATDAELAQRLAQASGGRWLRAEHAADATGFVRRLSDSVARLPEVEVSAAPEAEVFPSGKLSLEAGEELTLLVKTAPGKEALDLVRVRARVAGKEQSLLPKATPTTANGVAQRFGAELIRSLERQAKPREDVIEASLSYGVMSKYTSFLVLESEEAYARFAIERKNRQEAEAPRVSGADLASLDGDGAQVSLDRIQPGDPEISIDAPRDCQSVTVVFPFGEQKTAVFDTEANHGRGAWMVRFLVDRDTPEGRYEVLAFIVYRDGHRELRKVSYTVDRSAPELKVDLKRAPRRPGWYEVHVTQDAPESERDLRRVEVRTPEGQSIALTPIRWAEFRGYVKIPARRGSILRVAGFDQALNHRSIEVQAP
ncbi:MAG TPA: VIT and VWA domain-containing protein [Polyangiaceae bacterium]|nr:VIT and VWA domain-containing protein [Polyangiaceae bacterium]